MIYQFLLMMSISVTEDEADYIVEASDEDGTEDVTYDVTSIPNWLSFVDSNDGTGLLSGTPSNNNVGTRNITIKAYSDGLYITVLHTYC